MERAEIILDVNTTRGTKSLREMKQELRDLQIRMSQTADPAVFAALEAEFAQLRNDIKDTSTAMRYLDPGEILGGWIKMTQGVVGSFAAITGAMSLFGNESEELQKIEKKSMALIQTMMGLEQMRQLLIDGGGKAEKKTLISSTIEWFKKTLGIQTNTAATEANTSATLKNATAQNTGAKSTKAAGVAMKGAGAAAGGMGLALGAVAVVVGAAAASIYKLVKATNDAERAEQKWRDGFAQSNEKIIAMKSVMEQLTGELITLGREYDVLTGKITQAQADQLTIQDQTNEKLKEQRGKFVSWELERDAEFKATIEEKTKAHNKVMDDWRTKAYENYSYSVDTERAMENAFKLEIESLTSQHHSKIENQRREHWKVMNKINEAGSEAEKIAAEKENQRKLDEQKRAWDEYLSAYKSWRQKIEDYNASMIVNETERELTQLELRKERELNDLNNSKLKATEKAKFKIELENYYANETKKIMDKKREADADAFLEEIKLEQARLDAVDNDLKEIENRIQNIENLKKEWEAARNAVKAESLSRTMANATWEEALTLIDKYYTEGVIGEEEYNKTIIAYASKNNEANEMAYEQGLILYEEYEKNKQAILSASIEAMVGKYAAYITTITDNLSSIFSSLTEMAMIEIEKQDYAWQQSYDERSEALNTHLEDVRRIFGEESQRYKDLLEEQKKMDEEKAEHDKKIAIEKKAAEQKYAKFQIGAQMAEATATFAQGVAGIWAQALATQGPFGVLTATALTALLTATYGTQMSLMIKQLGAVGKMRQGGLITGPSHEAGGVLKELEGGEFVINARAMSMPGMKSLASQLNTMGNTNATTSPLVVDSASVAEAVATAIKNIPITVLESDITRTQKRVQLIQNKNTL